MILKVVNVRNGLTTVVNVMGIERLANSQDFKVWDFCDNTVLAHTNSPEEAEQCINDLYEFGKASIRAELNWNFL